MKYKKCSFRHAEDIFLVNEGFRVTWKELEAVLDEITDEEIIEKFSSRNRVATKSVSDAINFLIKEKLVTKGWASESYIFAEEEYSGKGIWRLDFAKDAIAVEVAFNHGGDVAWNLIKPVLAGELNHVKKAITTTRAGVIITATDDMKKAGGFDGAIGTYEKYVQYLKPLSNLLTVPLIIIGLEPPETFRIEQDKVDGKTVGRIQKIEK